MADQPENLLGLSADHSLLDADSQMLPSDIPRPEPARESTARGKLVGVGVALTGTTLLGGAALAVLGVVELISGTAGLGAAALAAGALLIATHWGWVHVAEASADAIDARRRRKLSAGQERWLHAIEPYTRHQVSTAVAEDGSIEILRICFRPVRLGGGRFAFERKIELRERHDAEEPGAVVAEHAEQLRRDAALETERERRQYRELGDAHKAAVLVGADERDRLAVRRAASEALSERINDNLREPPVQG